MTSAVAELDPLAALIAKGAGQKLELLKQAGGVLSVSDVARLLRISRQAVDKRRREGKLRNGGGFTGQNTLPYSLGRLRTNRPPTDSMRRAANIVFCMLARR